MPQFLTLPAPMPADELRQKLRKWEPWGHRIDFDNGVSTRDCTRRIPFSENPLDKFSLVAPLIPIESLRGRRLLDVGCNAGYNSIHAAVKYGFSTVGIDTNPRHIEVARFLAVLAEASCAFEQQSAESFGRPGEFDVVLHFGILYHLRNPLLSLERTFQNLAPGGYLALETQAYNHPDDPNICYFMHMQNNDPTNYWALSSYVLKKNLELIGFGDVQLIKKVELPLLAAGMSRVILLARKPDK